MPPPETATPARASDGPASRDFALRSRRGVLVVATAVLGVWLNLYTITSVNVALPSIAEDLGASGMWQRWILNAYLVALSAPLLVAGTLADRFGRRRLFGIGAGIFALGSLGAALAPTTGVLVAARAVQGVGGAVVTPGGLAIVEAGIRAGERSRAIGAYTGLIGIASASGPVLGGVLSQTSSWRWVFVVPVGIAVAAVAVSRRIPETWDPDGRDRRLDLVGAGLLLLASAGASYSTIAGPERGWTAPPIVVVGAAALAAVVALALWERHHPNPMIPVALFRVRAFSVATSATVLVYAGLGVTMFLVSVFLQVAGGWSPIATGVALLPVTAMMILGSPVAGRALGSVGPRIPLTLGPLAMAGGILLFARLGEDPGWLVDVAPAALLFGVGLAATVSPISTTAVDTVSEHHAGAASGVSNTAARLAEAVSIALVPTLAGLAGEDLNVGERLAAGFPTAMHLAAALVALGAATAAVGLRRHDLDG